MNPAVTNPGGVPALTKKDFATDQEVRWCPGCGDYAILNAVQQVFPELGIPKEKFVIVSGIGCSSRFPYYMNTFGFHSIHGRAPAIASGVKLARPDLSVWVATGDGDALAIGGNHIIHMLRRNMDVKVLMFNNRIYGLTKGQYSPTSEQFKKTKSTPFGSLDRPFNPIALALGAEATFVARAIDIYANHLKEVIRAAARHKGSAFIEIYQNCNIFNDHAFDAVREKDTRDENAVTLEHGKPLVFGKNRDKGLRLNGLDFEVVDLSSAGGSAGDLFVHDETAENAGAAFLLAHLGDRPGAPTPIGVFRRVERPAFDEMAARQIREVTEKLGPGELETLLNSGDVWEVGP
jgi:2-oxoglutarate ferredoxin oxidoreductase subunit beta